MLYPLFCLPLVLVIVLAFMCRVGPQPLVAAEIQNGDFNIGFAYWNVDRISASVGSELAESGRVRTYARLAKPRTFMNTVFMGQKLELPRLTDSLPMRVAADLRIPTDGGPVTVLISCLDRNAPQTNAAAYVQLLVAESSPAPADGAWHTVRLDFKAPAGTNHLGVFVSVNGVASVDVTAVTLTTSQSL